MIPSPSAHQNTPSPLGAKRGRNWAEVVKENTPGKDISPSRRKLHHRVAKSKVNTSSPLSDANRGTVGEVVNALENELAALAETPMKLKSLEQRVEEFINDTPIQTSTRPVSPMSLRSGRTVVRFEEELCKFRKEMHSNIAEVHTVRDTNMELRHKVATLQEELDGQNTAYARSNQKVKEMSSRIQALQEKLGYMERRHTEELVSDKNHLSKELESMKKTCDVVVLGLKDEYMAMEAKTRAELEQMRAIKAELLEETAEYRAAKKRRMQLEEEAEQKSKLKALKNGKKKGFWKRVFGRKSGKSKKEKKEDKKKVDENWAQLIE